MQGQVTENEEGKSIGVRISPKDFEKLIHHLEKNTDIKIGFNLRLADMQAIFTLSCDSDKDLQELTTVMKSFFRN